MTTQTYQVTKAFRLAGRWYKPPDTVTLTRRQMVFLKQQGSIAINSTKDKPKKGDVNDTTSRRK